MVGVVTGQPLQDGFAPEELQLPREGELVGPPHPVAGLGPLSPPDEPDGREPRPVGDPPLVPGGPSSCAAAAGGGARST